MSKNDSSGMRGLLFGSESDNVVSNTNNHPRHQNNPAMRQPPPFMTDPDLEKKYDVNPIEQIDSAYKLRDRQKQEEALLKGMVTMENRIEEKLKEIDRMVVPSKKEESPLVKAGMAKVLGVPGGKPSAGPSKKGPLTVEQRREQAAQKFLKEQNQQPPLKRRQSASGMPPA